MGKRDAKWLQILVQEHRFTAMALSKLKEFLPAAIELLIIDSDDDDSDVPIALID